MHYCSRPVQVCTMLSGVQRRLRQCRGFLLLYPDRGAPRAPVLTMSVSSWAFAVKHSGTQTLHSSILLILAEVHQRAIANATATSCCAPAYLQRGLQASTRPAQDSFLLHTCNGTQRAPPQCHDFLLLHTDRDALRAAGHAIILPVQCCRKPQKTSGHGHVSFLMHPSIDALKTSCYGSSCCTHSERSALRASAKCFAPMTASQRRTEGSSSVP